MLGHTEMQTFMTGLQHFSVITDHQSLIPPTAAQNQVYGIQFYCNGSKINAPDALSHNLLTHLLSWDSNIH